MDAAFLRAANPRLPKVLGLRLQPLTLGHRFLLARHDSAFVSGGSAKIEDLMLSVFICSQPWRQAEHSLSSWWFLKFIWLWAWVMAWRKFIIPIEYNKFHAYWDEGHVCPEFDCPDGTSRQAASPYECRVLAMLMADFHIPRDKAMDVTLAEANALWAAQGERSGQLELMSDRVRQLLDFSRQRDEEIFGRRN